MIPQNSRLVILADRQTFPNLASRALHLCLQRLSEDWHQQYRHPLLLVESFVDRQLFRATAYKAAGWQALGYSAGFKRVAEDFYQRHDRPKELWVKELHPRVWQWLRAPQFPPHLAGYEKTTPPACVLPTAQMPSLFERFSQGTDWRPRIGQRHRLSTVLAITALACLSGVGQGATPACRDRARLDRGEPFQPLARHPPHHPPFLPRIIQRENYGCGPASIGRIELDAALQGTAPRDFDWRGGLNCSSMMNTW